jgi:hypothetical protein
MKKADAVAERAKALPLLVTAFIRMHALILCDTRSATCSFVRDPQTPINRLQRLVNLVDRLR